MLDKLTPLPPGVVDTMIRAGEDLVLLSDVRRLLSKIEAEPVPGWKIKRVEKPPFHQIEIVAPNGYAALISSHESNPANILYMLADALLKEAAARDLAAELARDPANDPTGSGPFWNPPKPEPDGYLYHFRKIGGGRRYSEGSIPYPSEWEHPEPDEGFEYAGKTAMYVRPETVDEAFERGRQQGMRQERALWNLAASSQEIAAGEAAARDEGATVEDSQRCIDARNRLWKVLDGPGSVIGSLEEAVESACSCIEYARRFRRDDKFEAGRLQGIAEQCALWEHALSTKVMEPYFGLDLSNSDLRLMAGELTANEIRAVRAVLRGLKARVLADLKSAAVPPPSTREADADEFARETGAISMRTGEPIDASRKLTDEEVAKIVARMKIEAFDRNLPEGFVLVPTIPTPVMLAALRADTTASLRWANALKAAPASEPRRHFTDEQIDKAISETLDAERQQTAVRRALLACRRLFAEALPKFNWGASALDADAIRLLNETPAKVEEALAILGASEGDRP